MNDSLPRLLLQRSEAGPGAVLWGWDAGPHFGPAFDRLLAAGVLTERAPATAWPPCRGCDCDAEAREVVEINGRLVAECPVDHAASTPLGRHEVRSFEVHPAELAELIARRSGLTGAPSPLAEGVWQLGGTRSGRAVVLVLDATAAEDPDLPVLLRGALGAPADAQRTVLVPPSGCGPAARRRLLDAGARVVSSADALHGDGFALDLDVVEAPAAGGPRLVMDIASRTVVLDGQLRPLAEQPFLLLRALAEAARKHAGFVDSRTLDAAIYRDGARRPDARELRDVVRELRDALAAGLAHDAAEGVRRLIKNRPPGNYRLVLLPGQISLRG